MIDSNARDRELNEALALLAFSTRKIGEEPDKVLGKRGLGRVHHRILFFIGRYNELSVGNLLAVLGVTKQALNRPLRELQDKGLVSSQASPSSGRVKILRLTKEGALLEDKVTGLQRAQVARAFEAAGLAKKAGFRAVVEELGGGAPFGPDRLKG